MRDEVKELGSGNFSFMLKKIEENLGNRNVKWLKKFLQDLLYLHLHTEARSIIHIKEEQYSQYVGMLYWVALKMWPLCSSTWMKTYSYFC